MNLFELDNLVAIIEAENNPQANGKLLAYYAKARKTLVSEITSDIIKIMKGA